ARASKATGRIEFTCDTLLCGLRHAGNPNRSTQTGRWYQRASYEKRDNSAPVCFPNCALICLGSRVSFDLPFALGGNSETLAQHNRHLGVAAAGAVKANFSVCQRNAQLSRHRLHHGVALIAGLVQNQKIIGVGSVFIVS
ncbi:MAG: hypothetical protein ACLQU5_14700, partial [Isosphaeraceae bacterium]